MSRDALRPTIRYSDAASAPPRASRFPRLAPVPDRSPINTPPAVTTPTATHSSGLVCSRNRTRSNTATNSGLIVTNTSEDNTEVIDREVTHRAKCTARSAPASIVTGDRRSCCNSVTLRDTTTPRLEQKGSGEAPLVLNQRARGGPVSLRKGWIRASAEYTPRIQQHPRGGMTDECGPSLSYPRRRVPTMVNVLRLRHICNGRSSNVDSANRQNVVTRGSVPASFMYVDVPDTPRTASTSPAQARPPGRPPFFCCVVALMLSSICPARFLSKGCHDGGPNRIGTEQELVLPVDGDGTGLRVPAHLQTEVL